MTYDLLIKNARVVDGSGEPSFQADVAVNQGKIVGVGKYNGAAPSARSTPRPGGRPGFIDHHTHFDPQALWDPYCGSSVQNGHTTILVGQCGQVIAPARPDDHDWYLEFFAEAEAIPMSVMRQGIDFTWELVAEYMDALGKRRGCNVGTLVGHSGIRRYVMGEAASERAEATPEELAADEAADQRRDVRRRAWVQHLTARPWRSRRRRHRRGALALADVLGELGTGVMQVSGGAPGGTKATRQMARDLAARTGRPTIYNLVTQPIERPEEWQEHLRWLEDAFHAGARCYGSCVSVVAGPIFDLRLGSMSRRMRI